MRGVGGDPAQHVEAVGAAVQGRPGLVHPGLGREELDVGGGHVGDVGEQDVHPAAQAGRQGVEEVALEHLGAGGGGPGQVAAGAAHGGRVEVGRAQPHGVAGLGGERRAEGAAAAAQVDDLRVLVRECGGGADQELAAPAGYEHPGVDGDPQTGELGPADDVFERAAGGAAADHGGQPGGGVGGGEQDACLVLGEDAAGGTQPCGHGGAERGGRVDRQGNPSEHRWRTSSDPGLSAHISPDGGRSHAVRPASGPGVHLREGAVVTAGEHPIRHSGHGFSPPRSSRFLCGVRHLTATGPTPGCGPPTGGGARTPGRPGSGGSGSPGSGGPAVRCRRRSSGTPPGCRRPRCRRWRRCTPSRRPSAAAAVP